MSTLRKLVRNNSDISDDEHRELQIGVRRQKTKRRAHCHVIGVIRQAAELQRHGKFWNILADSPNATSNVGPRCEHCGHWRR